MTLAELIKARGVTARQVANELGFSDAEMSRFVKRRREPSLEKSAQIIEWSGGEISITELTAIREEAPGSHEEPLGASV